MAYDVIYKKSISKDLEKIPAPETRRILDKIERELSRNPGAFPSLEGDFAGLRRMRIGDYRVIFLLLDREVLVLRIAHRKNAYKNGP